MRRALLDVNVLLALLDADHAQHDLATAWIATGVPAALTELITLGRTLARRAGDVLAHSERSGTSNGGTEAICES